jgi:hypothetical protein
LALGEELDESRGNKLKVPEFDASLVKYPVLGPILKHGEIEVERYSRACAVLKSLQRMVAPIQWAACISDTKRDCFANKMISVDYIPAWMKPSTRLIKSAPTTTRFSVPSRPSKKFFLKRIDRTACAAEETASRLLKDLDGREDTLQWVQSIVEFVQLTVRAPNDNEWVRLADFLLEFPETLDHLGDFEEQDH